MVLYLGLEPSPSGWKPDMPPWNTCRALKHFAPALGLEPSTLWLTASFHHLDGPAGAKHSKIGGLGRSRTYTGQVPNGLQPQPLTYEEAKPQVTKLLKSIPVIEEVFVLRRCTGGQRDLGICPWG